MKKDITAITDANPQSPDTRTAITSRVRQPRPSLGSEPQHKKEGEKEKKKQRTGVRGLFAEPRTQLTGDLPVL